MIVCVQWCLYRHCLQGRRDDCLCTVVSLLSLFVGQCTVVSLAIVCRVMIVCVQWCLYRHCLQGRRDVCLCTVVSLLSLFVGQERCLFVYSGVFTLIVCRVGEMFVCVQWCLYRHCLQGKRVIVCVQWCLYSHCLQGRRDDCLCTVVSLLSLFVGQEG